MADANRRPMPKEVWVLGFVSLFMDVSSEMIHSLLPIFLVGTLGASAIVVGALDGTARALAMVVKVFSGALSDWFGRRKPLAILGYGLGAISKPLFAIAPGVSWVVSARLLDRFGKGIRGAPRDALVADVTPEEIRGEAYGLRQSLDTIGAFAGPLLAVLLLMLWTQDLRQIFWLASVPAFISVALLLIFLKEPRAVVAKKRGNPLSWSAIRKFPRIYWQLMAFAALFMLARFSDAFLILRAEQGGLTLAWIPLVLVVMNLAYSLSSYPAGYLSDRIGVKSLLVPSLGVLLVANLVFAAGNSIWHILVGALLWGLHLGLSQGVFAALVSKHSPKELRGTAFGLFNCICGFALLFASLLAGILWEWHSAEATFLLGALVCALALWLGRLTQSS